MLAVSDPAAYRERSACSRQIFAKGFPIAALTGVGALLITVDHTSVGIGLWLLELMINLAREFASVKLVLDGLRSGAV